MEQPHYQVSAIMAGPYATSASDAGIRSPLVCGGWSSYGGTGNSGVGETLCENEVKLRAAVRDDSNRTDWKRVAALLK